MPFDFNITKISSYLAVLAILSGCDDNLVFTGQADEKKIVAVVRAAEDSTIQILLNESLFITEDTFTKAVSNAEIRLYQNGVLKDALRSSINGFAKSTFKVRAADSLEIIIRKDGFNKVDASVQVPNKFAILQFDSLARLGNDLGVRMVFNDKANVANFYLIELFARRWVYKLHPITFVKIDSTLVWEPVSIESVTKIFFSDQNIVTSDQKFELFNDKIFDGQNYILDLNLNAFNLQATPIKSKAKTLKVKLRNINEDYFYFLTSLSLNRPIYGSPFSISSQVPGNMEGGYGIFASYTISSAFITLK